MNHKALLFGTILSVSMAVAAPVQAHDDYDYPYGLLGGLFLGLQLNHHHGHGNHYRHGDRHYRHREYRRSDSHGYRHRDKHRRGHGKHRHGHDRDRRRHRRNHRD
ncbi:MAG: hypothetical protein KZQ90_02265 [Candidatus Thiodiazotropha sp. (ex Codakia rugifera)]|nr:hypothetical protein [Candidatus Thiodiazotropha sp. (ex Codakia rugifera)]